MSGTPKILISRLEFESLKLKNLKQDIPEFVICLGHLKIYLIAKVNIF